MKKLLSVLLALLMLCSCGIIETAFAADPGITGFKATSGDKKISLSWSELDGADKYTVNWKRSESSAWKTAGATKKTSANVTGLSNGVSYDFKITSGSETSAVLTISPSADKKTTVKAPEPEKTSIETAKEAVSKMGAGYNIGNTFDSAASWLPSNASVKQHETAWGNPQVTKKFVEGIAKAGFKSVRLPVTWGYNADSKGNVRKEWLDRVQEVVDWIIDNDMYVIINVHHDTGTDGWIHASESSYKNSKDRFANIWKCIAERFKDYGEKLIFECFNETLNDANDWGSTKKEDADVILKYEQLFVDTVRKTGGKNAERNLVVSTYAASSGAGVINAFRIPDDTVDGHMIMEVHNYDPAGFVRNVAPWTTVRKTWGTEQDKRDIDNFMKTLSDKAAKLGIPAIVGEFGSENKNNESDRAAHAAYFVKAAAAKGIAVFWWDNGYLGNDNEQFKLIDRNTGEVVFPKVAKALVDNAL